MSPASGMRDSSTLKIITPIMALWPSILGLSFARTGIIVGSYGSYVSTDLGIFTDGATLGSLGVLLVLMVALFIWRNRLSKRAVNRIQFGALFFQAVCLGLLGFLDINMLHASAVQFGLSILNSMLGIICMAYWLRRFRGATTTTAVMVVFLSLAFSELVILAAMYIENPWDNVFAVVCTLLQVPCMLAARSAPQAYSITSPTQASDYFGFMEGNIKNVGFMVVTGLGIGFMSVVIGLMRGFPNGESIAFTTSARLLYMVLTLAVAWYVIRSVLYGRRRVMTLEIWIIMQALACMGLIMYAALPAELEYGAVFTTALNAVMVGFVWYSIVAFMSYGWRDPYYYAIGGFAVFLVPRALARMAQHLMPILSISETLMISLMGAAVVISTQFILIQLLRIQFQILTSEKPAADVSSAVAQEKPKSGLLERVMGIDSDEASLTALRMEATRQNMQRLGQQFLLSDREIEVLTYYAMGYTQQRVAEELFISAGTVHAHIKRIYAKTGLHSRQAILDYVKHYADEVTES